MQDEAERMNRLVGDLMSLNRVEGNERVRPTQRVVLNDIIARISRKAPISVLAGRNKLKSSNSSLIRGCHEVDSTSNSILVSGTYSK